MGAGASASSGVTFMQRWDRHYDVWLACELGNLPVVRRCIDMGSAGVHDVNPITGENLLQVMRVRNMS
jgi:hypothetical protein